MSNIKIVNDAYGRPHPVKEEELFEYGIKPDGSTLGTAPSSASSIRLVKIDIDPMAIWASCYAGSPYVELFQPYSGEQIIDLYVQSYTLSDWGAYGALCIKGPSGFQNLANELNDYHKSGIVMTNLAVKDASYNAYDTSGENFFRGLSYEEPLVASFDQNSPITYLLSSWEPTTTLPFNYYRIFTSAGLVASNAGTGTTGSTEPNWSSLGVGDSLSDGDFAWNLVMTPPAGGSLSVIAVVAKPEQVYP